MAAVRDFSTSDSVFKSVINDTLKDFPLVEYLCEEQMDCIKHMVSGIVWNPSQTFWRELNSLSTLSMNNAFDEWKSQCDLYDHGGLSRSRGHNERPSWTVEYRSCSKGNKYHYWQRSRKELETESKCANTVCDLSHHGNLPLCDSPCGVNTSFRFISIARYVLKSLSIGFRVSK